MAKEIVQRGVMCKRHHDAWVLTNTDGWRCQPCRLRTRGPHRATSFAEFRGVHGKDGPDVVLGSKGDIQYGTLTRQQILEARKADVH